MGTSLEQVNLLAELVTLRFQAERSRSQPTGIASSWARATTKAILAVDPVMLQLAVFAPEHH